MEQRFDSAIDISGTLVSASLPLCRQMRATMMQTCLLSLRGAAAQAAWAQPLAIATMQPVPITTVQEDEGDDR